MILSCAVTINGNGATLTGPGGGRGLVDDRGSGVTVDRLATTGFGAPFSNNAPVLSEGGPTTLSNCSVTGNSAPVAAPARFTG